MGLTIHYTLEFSGGGPAAAREQVAELRRRALDLPFQEVGELIELDGDGCNFETADEHRWLLIQARKYISLGEEFVDVAPRRLVAFRTDPGEGCESANFGLCLYPPTVETRDGEVLELGGGWSWSSFCKTQYASNPEYGGAENFLRCHTTIVALLDEAAEMGLLGEVTDESEFWTHRSHSDLAEEVTRWNRMIAGFAGRLKDKLGGGVEAPITEFPNFEHLEAKGRDST
jgi:hypothetical protein